MRTQVCLTIDTEFSIAGAFGDERLRPVAEPFVWCDVGGRSEGLGFLLQALQKYRLPATFFIETAHRYYFTADSMGAIARRIRDDGHELQLHVHPCWAVFQHADWRARVRAQPRQDDFAGRGEDASVALIAHGQQTFRDWGLAPPRVFRSGSLQHDDTLYRALARCGIPYSSSVGLAIFDSGDPAYRLYAGRHLRHGVVECPVLTYCDWSVAGHPHLKSLTISGASVAETCRLLEHARREGIALVVILTHPFEYIQSRDRDLRRARRHGVNQQRLLKLCRFLDSNRDRFVALGLGEAASLPMARAEEGNVLLDGVLWQTLARMVTQAGADCRGKLLPATAAGAASPTEAAR